MKKYLKIYKDLPVQMKASIWFLIASFLQKGISTITTPIFTRILTTSEYGQYSVFSSWMAIITPIVSLNLFSGVYSQGVVKFESDRKRFSSSLQGLTLTMIIMWTVIYMICPDFWNNIFSLSTMEMLAMLILIWLSAVYSFWSMNQRIDFKYKGLVFVTLLASILQPVVSIVFILHSENKVLARIFGMIVVQLFLYSWMFLSMMMSGKEFFSKKYWVYALKFNIPLLPHYLSMNILSSSDRIMIGKMCDTSSVGIYNLAYSVSLIMTIFNTALLQTIEPWIYRKLKDKRVADIERVAYPSFIIIAAVNILLIMFAPEVITIFAPKQYKEAIWVIPSVTLSVFFTFLYTFFATFEFYYEKTNYIAGATVGGAMLNIVLNYIFIKRLGFIAAGYTTLFSYILFAVLHYYFMRKICKQYLNNIEPYNLKLIIEISIGSLGAGFLIMITYTNIILRYMLIIITFLILFVKRKKLIEIAKMLLDIRKEK